MHGQKNIKINKKSAGQCFVTKICFYSEALLVPRPTPKLEYHPLSDVRNCLFNILAATIHTGGRSSIRNPKTMYIILCRSEVVYWKELLRVVDVADVSISSTGFS
jgi:hypothetical protein